MKLQIKDFAELTGVSVRTLHYYDEIGLLKPSEVDDCSGYRYYDSSCLGRMREILFYRELDFSLKSIAQILSSPDYDKEQALRKQRQLLVLKKNRLEKLIAAIDSAEKRDFEMNNEYEKTRKRYADEARERWSDTEAYKESEQRTANYSATDWSDLFAGMDAIIEGFAELKAEGVAPDDDRAHLQVEKLKQFITDRMYTCTDEILSGLGQMYIADERFTKNIDRHGKGTAAYVSECIKSYCS